MLTPQATNECWHMLKNTLSCQVAMEFMGGGCLTEILEQFEDFQMTEGNIAWVCQEVLTLLPWDLPLDH